MSSIESNVIQQEKKPSKNKKKDFRVYVWPARPIKMERCVSACKTDQSAGCPSDPQGRAQKLIKRSEAGKSMQPVFEIHMEISELEPLIWRRVVVPEDMSLVELHAVIQGAMGWQNRHLHSFEIDGRRYEIPENNQMGPERGSLDERCYRLIEVVNEGTECLYVYDFGDDWRHLVRVEDHRQAGPQDRLPRCVAGELACPPEDCGEPYRYPEFLAAFGDNTHPEHQSVREWAGPFDPNVFSISQSNALIGATLALYRGREKREKQHC